MGSGGFKNLYVYLRTNVGQFNVEMLRAGAVVKNFGNSVDAQKGKVSAASQGWSKLATGVKVGLLAAAVSVATFTAKAIEFERNMRNVNAISGMSEQQLQKLGKSVLQLSATVPQGAQDLSKGLYDIASSGFKGADGLKVLTAAAKAASAGLSTTAVSAKGITAVLNAYGMSAAESERVSDALFQTVNFGVITFEELAEGIGDYIGAAAAAGISIEEVGSAIATMTLSGISAAESGTSLNRVIQSLVDPSDALAATYKKLGISIEEDLKNPAKGLHYVIDQLRTATGGTLSSTFKLFPEMRAARGIFALTANAGKNYSKVVEEMGTASRNLGATQKALDEQMKGLGMQWDILKNKVLAWGIGLGTKVIPVLSEIVSALSHGKGALKDFFSGFSGVAGNVVKIMKGLSESVGPLVVGFAKLAGGAALGALTAFLRVLEGITGFLSEHQGLVVLLAAAYAATLAPAIIKAGVSLYETFALRGMYALDKVTGGVGKLGSALGGLSASTVAGGALMAGIVLLGAAWADSKREAEEYIRSVEKGLGRVRDLEDHKRAISALKHEVKATRMEQDKWLEAQNRGFSGKSFGEFLMLPKKWLDLHNKQNAATESLNKFNNQQENLAGNIHLVADATGMSEQAVAKFVKASGVDLTGAVQDSAASREELINYMGSLAAQAGVTAGEFKKMVDSGLDPEIFVKAGEAAKAAGDAFSKDYSLVGQFADMATNGAEASEKLADAQERVAEAGRKAAEEQAQAAERAAEAGRAVEEAARRHEDAGRALVDAGQKVRDSQQRELESQEALSRARVEAVEDIEAMSRSLKAMALDEEGSALAVEEALARLNETRADPKTTSLEKRRADLSYRQSVQNLEDVRRRRREAQEEYDRMQANGVEGSQKVQDAQKGVASAERETADARRALSDANRGLADSAREVEEAQRKQAKAMKDTVLASGDMHKANRDLLKAQQEAAESGIPLGQKIKQFYEEAVAEGTKFVENSRRAMEMGLDPKVIAELLQAGPKEAGPILEAIVNESNGLTIGFVNDKVKQLEGLNTKMVEMARITSIAMQAPNRQFSIDFPNAIRVSQLAMDGLSIQQIHEQLGIPIEDLIRMDVEFGLALDRGQKKLNDLDTTQAHQTLNDLNEALRRWAADPVKKRLELDDELARARMDAYNNPANRAPGGFGDGHADGAIVKYAQGGLMHYAEGHHAQIARAGDWRVWAEPETGGEAYIPLAPSKRDRSMKIWQRTGELLGAKSHAEGLPPGVGMVGRGGLAGRAGVNFNLDIDITANFGPGTNAADVTKAMKSIVREEVTEALVDVVSQSRAG